MIRAPALLSLLVAATAAGAGACQVERVPDRVRGEGPAGEAARPDTAEDGRGLEARIRADLARSAAGWNRGDLDAFMADYRRAPTTTYIGGSGLRAGYRAIRERYAPLFEEGARRDSLRFEDLRVRRLADGLALATARWVLYPRGDEVADSGPFTLVLRRVDGEWKIVHDHSSSYEGEGSGAGEADEG